MKKICVLILLVISCLACNSLDDWTTKDVLNDGGTDSDTSTALVNKDTAPWADNCMEQLDAWIAGNALPGDGCYWGNGSSSCSRGDYGELFCVDNRMRVMCPEGEWMNFDEMLDAVSDRCFWQITGTVPTDSDMPVVWTDCNAAFDAWIAGDALPQDFCSWQSSFEPETGTCTRAGYGTVYCMDDRLGMLCEGTNPHALEDATMQCAWQKALDTDTDTSLVDSPVFVLERIDISDWIEPSGDGFGPLFPHLAFTVLAEAEGQFSVLMGVVNGTSQETCAPTVEINGVLDVDDHFILGPADFRTVFTYQSETTGDTNTVQATIYDMTLSGTFAPGRDSFMGNRTTGLSGVLDMREITPIYSSGDENIDADVICDVMHEQQGVSCEPCPSDGQSYCLTHTAWQVAGTVRDVSLTAVEGYGCVSSPACEADLNKWIAGEMLPGDPCDGWGATEMDESCALAGYGEIFCLAGKLAVQCPEGGELLDDATDECQWEHDTAADAPWNTCEEALEAWLVGHALPGDACTWSPVGWDGLFCQTEIKYGAVMCVDGKIQIDCVTEIITEPNERCLAQMQDTDVDTDSISNGPLTDCLDAYDAWAAGTIFAGAECDFAGEMCGRQTGTVTCVHGALQTNCSGDTDPGGADWMTENDTGCGFWTDCNEALTAWIGGDALPGDPCAWNVDGDSSGSCMEPGYGIMACSAGAGLTVTCPVTAESGEVRWLSNPTDVCEWQEGDTDSSVDTDTTPVSWSDCQAALYATMNFWEARPGDACTFPDGTMCGDALFGWVYCEDYKLRMNCDFTDTDFNSPNAYTEPDQLCPIE